MDALSLLRSDHRKVERLLRRFESSGGRETRERIVHELVRELSAHAAIEEQMFYPVLKDQSDFLKEKVLEALEEHSVAKWELLALDKMSPEDERYEAKVKVLGEAVLKHIEEEESELFPAARQFIGRDGLDLLAGALEQAKEVAPTRPHPRAPDEPPGNLLAGAAARVLDIARDAMQGRRVLRRRSISARTASRRRGKR